MADCFASDGGVGEAFAVGERFRGYVIERRIGRGGSGMVFLARHEMLDTLYAVKVMEPAEAEVSGEEVRRFVREAKIAARIQHRNLVRVHDAGFDEGKNIYYLVMDYVSGGTLRDRIAFGGPLPAREAADVIRSVAQALAAGARMGLVHRDLKPENILFAESGTVKLVDLGVAKICDGNTVHTSGGATFGTPAYVAPEQAVDASNVDSRADVYSLGVVFFEMLCGKRPYAGETPMAVISQVLSDERIPDVKRLNPDVPNWASALVFRMCAKDPDKRIPSPEKLVEIINGYLHGTDAPADYSPSPEKNPFEIAARVGVGDVRRFPVWRDLPLVVRVLLCAVASVVLVALIAFL